MICSTIAKNVKADTTQLRDDTAVIIKDTSAIRDHTTHILAEIGHLRSQLTDTAQPFEAPSYMLDRYLDSLTSYAESEFPISEDYAEDREGGIMAENSLAVIAGEETATGEIGRLSLVQNPPDVMSASEISTHSRSNTPKPHLIVGVDFGMTGSLSPHFCTNRQLTSS
jgi:hypothetical protein